MPIIFHCPRCGRELYARTSSAGKKGYCVHCDAKIVVPDFRGAEPDEDLLADSDDRSSSDVRFLEDDDED